MPYVEQSGSMASSRRGGEARAARGAGAGGNKGPDVTESTCRVSMATGPAKPICVLCNFSLISMKYETIIHTSFMSIMFIAYILSHN